MKNDWDIKSNIWYTTVGRDNLPVIIFDSGIVEINNSAQLPFIQLDKQSLKELVEKQELFIKARIFHKRATGE